MEAKPKKKQGKGRPKTVFKKLGRKPKLDIQLINELEQLIRDGNTIQTCCAKLDISETAYYNWVGKAYDLLKEQEESEIAINSDDEIYIELVKTVKRAEAQWKIDMVKLIDRHAMKNWQAGAWRLERKYPNEFGLKQEETTKDETPLAINVIITDKKNPDKIKQMEKTLE